MNMDEKVQLLILLAAVAFYFYTFISTMQNMYMRNIRERMDVKLRVRNKKGPPPPRTIMYYETVVLKLSSRVFRSHFRVTRTSFKNLCQLLGPKLAPNVDGMGGRPNTSIEKQLLPVLWLLATPESFRSVADRFNIGKSTLFYFFEKFVVEMSSLSSRFIKWPTPSEMINIRKQFFHINKFDIWIIGAVDGTYIVIKAPTDDPEVYRTRKCNFAITLQGICVPSLQFIDCFVGFPGSVGDRRIFDNSTIFKNIHAARKEYFPTREYIVGDKAYPVYEWLQAPHIRRRVLSDAEELYNSLLSGTRQVIERAFALLFGRFRRLKFVDMSRLDLLNDMVIACCVLHNICISEMDFDDFIAEGMPHVKLLQEDHSEERSTSVVSLCGDQRRAEITANVFRKRSLS